MRWRVRDTSLEPEGLLSGEIVESRTGGPRFYDGLLSCTASEQERASDLGRKANRSCKGIFCSKHEHPYLDQLQRNLLTTFS